MNSIIEVQNLSFSYAAKPIFENISFRLERGVFLCIAGPNGAGKTTLLNLLCGLLKPLKGAIEIDSRPIETYSAKKAARKIAIVRQEFVPVFDFTAAQIVSMARTPYAGTFGFETQVDKKLITEAMEETNTIQFATRSMSTLSSGERQRVFIARALAQGADILLLDEPTSFLDLKNQVNIYDLLKQAQRERHKTIIAVTHDINLAAQYADQVMLISPPETFLFGRSEEVLGKEAIERIFCIKVFAGKMGEENFFLPIGKFSKYNQ